MYAASYHEIPIRSNFFSASLTADFPHLLPKALSFQSLGSVGLHKPAHTITQKGNVWLLRVMDGRPFHVRFHMCNRSLL